MARTPASANVEKVIRKNARRWQKRLGLGHWTIEHVFLDSFFGDDGEEDFKVTATTECRWQYFQGKIKWYLPSAVRHTDDHLERTLVHELVHCLLAVEQVLVDYRLNADYEAGMMTGDEYTAVQERNSEHLEMATEAVTKALWAGWEPDRPYVLD